MTTRINESKALTKHISCKCKFDGQKWNSNQQWNNNKCWCKCKDKKKHHVCEENHICNPSTCTCENDKYLEKLVYETVVRCDEIIDATRSEPINFNYEKQYVKLIFSISILVALSLIIILPLIIIFITINITV